MPSILIPEHELRVIRELNACEVKYLVIGGHAVRYHGFDRPADDVDLTTDTSPENATRLWSAIFNAIGRAPDFTPESLQEPKKEVRLRNSGFNLEILTTLPGLRFSDAFAARETEIQNGVRLWIISKEHLITAKRAAAEKYAERRAKDLRDVAMLERIKP